MCALLYNIRQDSGALLSDSKSVFPHRYALAGGRYCLRLQPGATVGHQGRRIIAMRPGKTSAMYYVSKNDGSSHFSRTLEEHNRAVAKYQLRGGR